MKLRYYWLTWILAAVLMVTGTVLPAAAAAYGDVNGDARVDAADALLVLRFAVGKTDLSAAQQTVANVNADNAINAKDALLILQFAVRKIDRFPAEDAARVTPGGQLTAIPALAAAQGYATPVAPVAIQQPFNTLTQINVSYNAAYDLDLQCYLYYVTGVNTASDFGGMPALWKKQKTTYHNKTTIGIMVPINRDNGEYLKSYAGTRGMMDVQTRQDGSYIRHSVMGDTSVYYMVPSEAYIEYKWRVLESYLKGGVTVVAMEEPELWNQAGYSEAFKEAYAAHFGTAWEDPSTSAEAMWNNQYFKAWMFRHAFEELGGRIKQNYPNVTVLITSHSNFSYGCHGISTGLAMYADLDCIDGVIGQTWSDDAAMSFRYGGESVSDVFAASLYAYNGYGEALRPGQTLYLLQDPASDIAGTLSEEVMQTRWQQTVVAAMMQNDTTSFQSTIWPQRAFDIASADYKTVQLNANRMFEEFHTLSGANYGGVPGIAIGMSDSSGWHIGNDYVLSGSNQRSISGVFAALEYDGVPVDTVYLEHPQLAEQLHQVNLLILSYDAVKPLTAQANATIAQWVKDGGRLLYLGGQDAFSQANVCWWGKQHVTPLQDLLTKLGLSAVTVRTGGTAATPVFKNIALDDTCAVSAQYAQQTLLFSGAENAVLTLGGQTTGFETAVGKGYVVIAGLPSAYYAQSDATEQLVRDLTALALQNTDTPYAPGDAFVSVRGRYTAYYSATKQNKTAADKTYIDLFSPVLATVPGGTVLAQRTPRLLYDVTDLAADTVPRVAFVGATEMAPRVEDRSLTVVTMAFPSNATASCLLLANGRSPVSVTVTQGTSNRKATVEWNAQNGTLLVRPENRSTARNVVITVDWGDAPGPDFQ